jgi:hypothetical protein
VSGRIEKTINPPRQRLLILFLDGVHSVIETAIQVVYVGDVACNVFTVPTGSQPAPVKKTLPASNLIPGIKNLYLALQFALGMSFLK